jgi:thiosulfate dehydrogenase
MQHQNKPDSKFEPGLVPYIEVLVSLVVILLALVCIFLYRFSHPVETAFLRQYFQQKEGVKQAINNPLPNGQQAPAFWLAPDINTIKGSGLEKQILYGRDLIMHTSTYLGPNGSVAQISNGMNCQNCHLDAGTKIFGNNYGSVYATYPRFRARSGSVESIYKRVNDCFERSLNGIALDTMSAEMQAIKAYLIFLGKNVPKGKPARGAGLKDLAFLERQADPVKGKEAYIAKCAQCHQANGSGIMAPERNEYTYPPLWGPHSYNDAAGLFRMSNFAKYIKYNMPLGATHELPQLTDDEAWDIAAFVNSMPRPHKAVPGDWPDISKKPIDHPFGPYSDAFSENQHKFGPFMPMLASMKK